ncbi:DUF4262 domain-containing protein [Streptomyces rhizosphaericus]|uniref:DUF4262 domain-containing protein n=1 Tax=Streptomyces rhizosphaericus TaxID=114699 RepID=UPI000A3BC66C|nr:DUF4262 domain-containing protein [Streptomyces rhizosphaericus]
MSDDFMVNYVARLQRVISEHGFAVQAVLGDQDSAPFCYTVGLHKSRGYELVMTGLDVRVLQGIIHSVVDRFSSENPTPNMPLDGLLSNGYRLLMRRVDSLSEFSMLRAVYGPEVDVPFWQAVWPDRNGVFPTDSSCSLSRGTQPLF